MAVNHTNRASQFARETYQSATRTVTEILCMLDQAGAARESLLEELTQAYAIREASWKLFSTLNTKSHEEADRRGR